MKRAALIAVVLATGCYRSHTRSEDAGSADANVSADAGTDAGMGCRARCDEPELVALLEVTDFAEEYEAPRLFVEARSVGERIVVLATRPSLGHTESMHRVLVFEPGTGRLTMSEPWKGRGLFAQHHDGFRIVPSPPDVVRALALMGAPEWEDGSVGFPTGNQTVSAHLLEWSLRGELVSQRKLSQLGELTQGCPGGCEAAITVDGDEAVISYAPGGVLRTLRVDLTGPSAGEWTEVGPIDDPQVAPWPHVAAIVGGERWIAGGGTFPFEPPRLPLVLGPDGPEPLAGTEHDPPPLLLGGDELVLGRYLSSERAFHIERSDGSRVVIPTGAAPLSSHLSRTSTGRLLLAWSSYAPGSFRDLVVTLTPDIPETVCGEVVPSAVVRVPEAVAHPSLLAHEHDGVTYLFTLPNDASGRKPEIAVFAIRGCALVP